MTETKPKGPRRESTRQNAALTIAGKCNEPDVLVALLSEDAETCLVSIQAAADDAEKRAAAARATLREAREFASAINGENTDERPLSEMALVAIRSVLEARQRKPAEEV